MPFVFTTPEMLAVGADDLQGIGSAIAAADMAAAAPTTGVLAPAADPVSARTAALLAAHAQHYQALSKQAEMFHRQFVQNLIAAKNSYAETEASNAAAIRSTPVLPWQHTANSVGPLGHAGSGHSGTGTLGHCNIGNQTFARANFGGQNFAGSHGGQTFGSGNVGSGNIGSQNIGTGKSGFGIPVNNNSGLGNPGAANAIHHLNSAGPGNGTGTQSANPAALAGHLRNSNPGAGNFSPANTVNLNNAASTSTMTSASQPKAALIMGGTGNPQPNPAYVTAVYNTYIAPNYPGYTAVGLYTHEDFWPVTGLHSLTFGQSIQQDLPLLDNAIMTQTVGGHQAVVVGYSQSATVATLEMRHLDALPASLRPSPNQLSFVLLGNPNNPNGGILERFAGLYIPGLNVPFNGATPANTIYPTAIYTIQYDGWADFPQYPINLLADLNAVAGIYYLHPMYPELTAAQLASATLLPVSPGYTGVTSYYLIPTTNLPLLTPLRAIPFAGNPLADLVQPDLTILIDLGYGNGYANIPTPIGLFPPIKPFPLTVELLQGAAQGVEDALADL